MKPHSHEFQLVVAPELLKVVVDEWRPSGAHPIDLRRS
jgi:hypothetical protein